MVFLCSSVGTPQAAVSSGISIWSGIALHGLQDGCLLQNRAFPLLLILAFPLLDLTPFVSFSLCLASPTLLHMHFPEDTTSFAGVQLCSAVDLWQSYQPLSPEATFAGPQLPKPCHPCLMETEVSQKGRGDRNSCRWGRLEGSYWWQLVVHGVMCLVKPWPQSSETLLHLFSVPSFS